MTRVKFQSTPPRRGRPAHKSNQSKWRDISIHAPAQGATFLFRRTQKREPEFQSTPPRRGRRKPRRGCSRTTNFNPRPRAGGDGNLVSIIRDNKGISIHAPAQGATSGESREDNRPAISIHAPAQGATVDESDLATLLDISIHAPAQGATSSVLDKASSTNISIHAPAQGATVGPSE